MNDLVIDSFFTLVNLLVLCCGIGWIMIIKFIPSLRLSWQTSYDAEIKKREEERRLTQEFSLKSAELERTIQETERLKKIIIQLQHDRAIADQHKQQANQDRIDYLKHRSYMQACFVADFVVQRTVFDKALTEASSALRTIFKDSNKVMQYDNEIIAAMQITRSRT